MESETPRALILFDGVCNLCNAAVKWVLARDPKGKFGFASLQSDVATAEIAKASPATALDDLPDSIVLIDDAGVHVQSDAAIRIARKLGFPYALLAVGLALPRPVRDAIYRFVARNRYRWFGRQETCMMPTPELASRFLDAEEPRRVIPEAVAAPEKQPTSWMGTWLSRLTLVYVLLYMLPFPIGLFWRVPLLYDIPFLPEVVGWIYSVHGMALAPLVSLAASVISGGEAEQVFTGSGDTFFHWVDLVVDGLLAVLLATVWTIWKRGLPVSWRTQDIYRVLARYYVGTTLLTYGWIKVFPLQFGLPGPDRLLQPYGDSSPMGIAWTFLGASVGYQIFAGLSEVVAGYLLLWRRTSLAGALAGAAVMANVMAINYFFDVPVKIFSTHLFLIALFVAAPDIPRLVGFLGFGLPIAAPERRPFWLSGSSRPLWIMIIHTLFIVGLTWNHVSGGIAQSKQRGIWAEVSPMEGIYRVESFQQGDLADRALPDSTRWVRVGINPPATTTLQFASGDAVRMRLALDDSLKTISLFDRGGSAPDEPQFVYADSAGGYLRLTGTFSGLPTRVLMRRDTTGSLLTSRGFNWVNEYPFNR